MNKKAILLSSVVIFSAAILVTYLTSTQFSEAEKLDPTINNFVMADDVNAVLTLKFQEGSEKINFPIFKMTSGMLSQNGPSFEVQGIVGPNSYLHKALDVAWETRKVNAVYYISPYQYFDVDVSITKKDQVLRNFDYTDCKIKNYRVDTLTDKEEGYTTSKNGFAIVDVIEFQCAGLQPSNPQYDNLIGQYKKNQVKDFGLNHYNMGGNSYAITTFKFEDGYEKINFPIFRTTSQILDNSGPTFQVEGVISSYPLLYSAIDEAKDRSAFFSTRNMGHNFFNVDVDLVNSGVLGLTLQYSDCRIKDYKTDTEFNTEEGFTKKNGFAIVDVIDVDCTGLNLVNHGYDNLSTNYNSKKLAINHEPVPFLMVDDLHAVTTFDFNAGTEKIDFPVFRQTGRVLSGSYPTFELQGAVGSYPLLNNAAENAKSRSPNSSGAVSNLDLFKVRVDLKQYDQVVRSFDYSNCRVTSYQIDTQLDKAEGYLNKTGFALLNYYSFECQGYTPINPSYDEMHKSQNTETTQNSLTMPQRSFDTWDDRFIAKKNQGH